MTTERHSSSHGSGAPRRDLAGALRDPRAYPEAISGVEMIETHISWVFLADDYVYKLKKPVKFDFLDFSTVAKRKAACEQELQLNRRLAPDVYLGILPLVAGGPAGVRIGGDGRPLDWVVHMRRLPQEVCLAYLIARQQVPGQAAESIAQMLVDFYRRTPAAAESAAEYRRRFDRNIRDNLHALLDSELPGESVRRVHEAQLRFLRQQSALLDRRIDQQCVVDGHGDLRPEHIYLCERAVAIDCIEFNLELRQVDRADELAFLEMECEASGAAALGRQITQLYQQLSGDSAPDEVRAFYKAYRACVRSKVAALRGQQLPPRDDKRQAELEHAQHYLSLADDYQRGLGQPSLIVVRGLMGSGKSTLARAIAESIAAERLETDVLRQELFGDGQEGASYNEGRYSTANRQQVYDEMFRRAAEVLSQHRSIVLDGTFLSTDLRERAVRLAEQHGAQPLLVRCECPAAVAQARIAARAERGDTFSEARPELYDQQARDEEPDPPGIRSLVVNTTCSIDELLEKIFP